LTRDGSEDWKVPRARAGVRESQHAAYFELNARSTTSTYENGAGWHYAGTQEPSSEPSAEPLMVASVLYHGSRICHPIYNSNSANLSPDQLGQLLAGFKNGKRTLEEPHTPSPLL